jgi:hypothetical protein
MASTRCTMSASLGEPLDGSACRGEPPLRARRRPLPAQSIRLDVLSAKFEILPSVARIIATRMAPSAIAVHGDDTHPVCPRRFEGHRRSVKEQVGSRAASGQNGEALARRSPKIPGNLVWREIIELGPQVKNHSVIPAANSRVRRPKPRADLGVAETGLVLEQPDLAVHSG